MSKLRVSPSAQELRSLVDSAKKRLWIVSPYIGSWNAVRRILGEAWEKVDVRLLTDKDSGILARDTLEHFAAHRPIKSLNGVHAKLYIMDDSVLLTSANLTETAFTRRYEAGRVLTGTHAQELITLYELLWNHGEDVDLNSIKFIRSRNGNIDENSHGARLTKLYALPSAPTGPTKGKGEFADYPYFLEVYRNYVSAYLQAGKRRYPKLPLFLETDKFLNYLFLEHPKTPSHTYKNKAARVLSEAERIEEIQKYRDCYRNTDLDVSYHLKSMQTVQSLLKKSKIFNLTATEIEDVANSLNCFGMALAKVRFLKGNKPDAIRKAWNELIHGPDDDVKFRMYRCRKILYGFGKAAIQETLGYYYPDQYPLRNENTNAGLRFLGYNI
jgi:hypothetical protein